MLTQTILTADKVVKVETIVTDRVVQFDEILNSVSINDDDWHNEAPWEASDGWDHDCHRFGYNDHEGVKDSRGYCIGNRECYVIDISDEQLEQWGNYEYFRSNGCSKQVACELVAQVKRKALDQLVAWYSNGWNWYSVDGEYQDYSDGIGGVDCIEYAEQLRYEIANEIATQMEHDGYIVEGSHNPHEQTSRQDLQDRLNRNKTSFVIQ